MKKLKKIICPGNHKQKILMIFREEFGKIPIHKFWIHCGNMQCENPWVQIEFNIKHGVTVTPMPKEVKFDADKIPQIVVSNT